MRYPDGDSDLVLKKERDFVGIVCLWILLPTEKCVLRGRTSALHIVNPDAKQLAYLKGSITGQATQAGPVLRLKKLP